MGDTLLTIDALLALRWRFPGQRMELVGSLEAAQLLLGWGLVDRATSFDAPEVSDLFHAPPRVAARWRGTAEVVLWLVECSAIADAFRALGAAVVAANPRPIAPDRHVADQLIRTLSPLGAEPPLPGGALWSAPRPAIADAGSAAASAAAEGRALLHPGAGSPRKTWPAADFATLTRRLRADGWRVSILQGPADDTMVAEMLVALGPDAALVSVVRPSRLVALADALLAHAVYVGNDSGVTHLSARLGLRTLAIFGPTDPQQWAPRGPSVRTMGGDGAFPTVSAVWNELQALVKWPTGLGKPARDP